MPPAAADVTQLLQAAAGGDREAFDRAWALLYDELSALAHAQRRRWTGNETLGTSVLVHEAYLKLLGGAGARWEGKHHFFALAAQVMRHVLVTYAERQRAARRGGGARHVELGDLEEQVAGEGMSYEEAEELLALHEALGRLEATDARRARIVECRFFAGLSIPETAEALGISPATVKREWATARDWLYAALAARRG